MTRVLRESVQSDDDLLRPEQAAHLCGVNRTTLHRWNVKGLIRAVYVGPQRRRRFRRRDVLRLMNDN